ncbi:hypothetical protein WCE34_03675 [Luteimonas sp. MJ204]|uniref:hypothetical protein n=1 Tax=Luteimonas sp. MJ145 TaxID=3129234 RepID=UPI0031B9FE5A
MIIPARIRNLLLAIGFVAFGLFVFAPGLTGGFLFDDYPNLLLDDDWKLSQGATAQDWIRATLHGVASPAGRPLALLSFAANYYFHGLSPFHFKLGSLALHLLNGLLAWALLRQLLDHAATPGSGRSRWLPLLVAVAWTVHPMQISTVLYVVQRMEIGAATGILAALLCYVTARRRMLGMQRGWLWLLLAAAATMFGLGFKETAVIAPLLAFLIEATLFRFRASSGAPDRWLSGAFACGAVLALCGYLYVAIPFVATPEATLYAIRDFGPWERLLSQGRALVLYMQQSLFPLPENMTFYYDNFAVSRSLLQPATTLASLILLAVVAVLAFGCRHRWPLTALGTGWFFACHTLTSNVIPLELVFEHRNYLALLGILVALVQPLAALGRRLRLHNDACRVLAALPVLALAALCVPQAATWGSPTKLAWTLENRNPDSPRASYALGRVMLDHAGDESDGPQIAMARKLFQHVASLPGDSPLAAQGLILLDARHGRPVDTATWDLLRSSLTRGILGPEGLSALFAVSNCRIKGRCQFDDRELLATFWAVIEKNPKSAAVHTLYANFAWNILDDKPLAIWSQREAARLSPSVHGYQVALAKFLLASPEGALRNEGEQLFRELAESPHAPGIAKELEELRLLTESLAPPG